jgi:hypothetical protein
LSDFVCTGSVVKDTVLEELKFKILAELPEELAAATSFKSDAKASGLVMDFAVKLDKADYPLLLGVVKKFSGDFINQKDSEGKDHGCFYIPKSRPADPAVVTPQVEKHIEEPKQPSPITIFSATYCGVCEDFGTSCSCQANSERRSLCVKILAIQTWQTINVNLEKLCKVAFSQPVQAASSNHADARSPPAAQPPQKVERSTRPTEGHREGDVVWIYAENQKGERYEKALEKDNQRSNDYFELRGQIVERINAGKKGLELAGKWLWLSDRDDYIGRKAAKQFAKGGRRY